MPRFSNSRGLDPHLEGKSHYNYPREITYEGNVASLSFVNGRLCCTQ